MDKSRVACDKPVDLINSIFLGNDRLMQVPFVLLLRFNGKPSIVSVCLFVDFSIIDIL
jgi:hypothetical protein